VEEQQAAMQPSCKGWVSAPASVAQHALQQARRAKALRRRGRRSRRLTGRPRLAAALHPVAGHVGEDVGHAERGRHV